MEAESCNSGIPKTETGEFLSVQGQSELQNKHKASWCYYLAKHFFFNKEIKINEGVAESSSGDSTCLAFTKALHYIPRTPRSVKNAAVKAHQPRLWTRLVLEWSILMVIYNLVK